MENMTFFKPTSVEYVKLGDQGVSLLGRAQPGMVVTKGCLQSFVLLTTLKRCFKLISFLEFDEEDRKSVV